MGANCCAERDIKEPKGKKKTNEGVFTKKLNGKAPILNLEMETMTKSHSSTAIGDDKNTSDNMDGESEEKKNDIGSIIKEIKANQKKAVSNKRNIYSKNIKVSINEELAGDIVSFKNNVNRKTTQGLRKLQTVDPKVEKIDCGMTSIEEELLNKYEVLTPKSAFFLKHKVYKTNNENMKELNFSNMGEFMRSQSQTYGNQLIN